MVNSILEMMILFFVNIDSTTGVTEDSDFLVLERIYAQLQYKQRLSDTKRLFWTSIISVKVFVYRLSLKY